MPGEIELLTALVEGPFAVHPWMRFLDRLRDRVGAEHVTLNISWPSRPFEETLNYVSGGPPNFDIRQVLQNGFHPLTPPLNERLAEGQPYSLDEWMSALDPLRRPICDAVMRVHGLTAYRQMRVREPTGVHAWLSITRRKDDFSDADTALLRTIGPILRSVLQNYVQIERERFSTRIAHDGARRLQFAWLAFDREGLILACDEQCEKILASSATISRAQNGKLAVIPTALDGIVKDAILNLAKNPRQRPRAITLCREPWLDMLMMSGAPPTIATPVRADVIAYVHGDSWSTSDRVEQLAEMFGLSFREAEVSLAFCRGMSITDAAAHFGLAIETARNYSKSIYLKTGARGMPDLIRLIMRSVLAFDPR